MYSWSVKVHRKVCHCHCHCYSKRTVCATARWVSSTNFYPSRRAAQMVCSPRFRAWHWYSSCRRRSAWRHIRSTWTPGTAAAADATWCVEQRRCRRRRQLLQPVSARASLPVDVCCVEIRQERLQLVCLLADIDCTALQPVTSSMMNELNEGVVNQEV